MKSPFTIGPMITKPEDFIGHKAEVNHLITRLRTMLSCSVIGEGRIGKSSPLYRLRRIASHRLRALVIEHCTVLKPIYGA
jgi:hypothetical protein